MATPESRFSEVPEEFLSSLLEKSVPKATQKSTKYGMNIFNGKKTLKAKRTVTNCSQEMLNQQIIEIIATMFFTEWFSSQSRFKTTIDEITKAELKDCLQVFYAAVKQKMGKISSLRIIRAAIERNLKQPPSNKKWSIVGDPAFEKANKVLNAICKRNAQEGRAAPTVHKQAITREQAEHLFRSEQLGSCDSPDPAQLLRTSWFYITLYFGKRGRENQTKLIREMLVLRSTPQGRKYYELRNVLGSKNHQGGLYDNNDESDGKIFEVPHSPRCPVKTVQNYLNHLNPELEVLFQRPKAMSTARKEQV